MQIQTLSMVVGGTACNARCPFCVARLTTKVGLKAQAPEMKLGPNFDAAVRLAEASGVTTILLTGKGEPTLWPEHITDILMALQPSKIAIREMQTNAIPLMQEKNSQRTRASLEAWRLLGLNTIAISVVSDSDASNEHIYINGGVVKDMTADTAKRYPPLVETIAFLRSFGFSIRLSCIMVRGFVDDFASVKRMAEFAKKNDVFQLTLIPVSKPQYSEDAEAYKYVSEHLIEHLPIAAGLDREGKRLLEMPHGAVVFDLHGQNVCLSNCLTETTNVNQIRQLIFYVHDQSLRYSWQYEGARIL